MPSGKPVIEMSYMKSFANLLLLLVSLLCVQPACAEKFKYRYRLVHELDKDVCRHMTKVYNQYFKHPWNEEEKGGDPDTRYFGKLPHELFETYPGVKQNPRDSFLLLLNFRPTSPEFDAIKWREARMFGLTWSPLGAPMLVSNIDVDNDGKREYFVKHSFLRDIVRNEGVGGRQAIDDVGVYELDKLTPEFIPKPPFEFMDKRYSHVFETNNRIPQIRPFLYKNKYYFHAYEEVWSGRRGSEGLPRWEYVNIFRVESNYATGDKWRLDLCRIMAIRGK